MPNFILYKAAALEPPIKNETLSQVLSCGFRNNNQDSSIATTPVIPKSFYRNLDKAKFNKKVFGDFRIMVTVKSKIYFSSNFFSAESVPETLIWIISKNKTFTFPSEILHVRIYYVLLTQKS